MLNKLGNKLKVKQSGKTIKDFVGQWFTPFRDYAESFMDPERFNIKNENRGPNSKRNSYCKTIALKEAK